MAKYQKIFFSYSRTDGEKYAFQLAADLRKAGCNVWIDQFDIRPGKSWDLEIEKALENATCVLLVVTEKSVASKNTLDEVYYAIDNNKEVIPVIFENCQLPFRLKRLQYIDFTKDYNSGLHLLSGTLNISSNTGVADQKNELQHIPNQEINEQLSNKRFIVEQYSSAEKPAGKKRKTIAVAAIAGVLATITVISLLIFSNKPQNKQVQNNIFTDTNTVKHDSQFVGRLEVKKADPKNAEAVDPSPQTVKTGDTVKASDKPSLSSLNRPVQISDTNYYRLQIKNGGNFIDAVYCQNKVALGAASDFDNGGCQLWRLVPAGNGWYGLQLKNGDRFLAAENCSSDIILLPSSQFDPNDGCQLWRFVSNGDGWSRLQLRASQQYLDADHCTTKLVLNPGSDFAEGACQLWKFVH